MINDTLMRVVAGARFAPPQMLTFSPVFRATSPLTVAPGAIPAHHVRQAKTAARDDYPGNGRRDAEEDPRGPIPGAGEERAYPWAGGAGAAG